MPVLYQTLSAPDARDALNDVIARAIVVVGDTVWAVGHNRVTPVKDGKAGESFQLAEQPADIAVDGDELWVALPTSGIQRYDANKRTPIGGPIDIDVSSDTRLTFGEGGLWVANPIGGEVVRIVAAGDDGHLAVGDGAVWVSNLNRLSLLRLSWW